MKSISEIIRDRILVLDGAIGTMIQSYHLTEQDFRGDLFINSKVLLKGNNDLLCLTRPDVVTDIHRKYLDAGADIIETNTFNANSISQLDYSLQDYVYVINYSGAKLARRVADEYTKLNPDKPRFVAGSVGPTNKTCSMSPDVNHPERRSITFDELVKSYQSQIEALIDGGVDTLLIETIFDTLNAKAAVFAANKVMDRIQRKIPVMLSITISDASGRLLSGQTIEAFLASISEYDIFSVGLNCSLGPSQLKPYIRLLSDVAPYYISFYPNAGLPNSLGMYDFSPESMAFEMKEIIRAGLVNIIGGCCGTTEEHIAAYKNIIDCGRPHIPSAISSGLVLSGLEPLKVSKEFNFLSVGERCNVAGSKKFLRLISEKNYHEALEIARKQVEDGAQVIDINMDDALLDSQAEMVHFLNLIVSEPDIAKVPIMLDSSKWEVIEAGLKCLQGKSVVNSLSLKEGEEVFLQRAKAIKEFGASVVVMAFDEKGQADSFERKIQICSRAYRLLTKNLNFNPCDIIFDPNILAVATGIEAHNNYALDFINATKWLKNEFPLTHVSGGVSNLSFSFRGNNYVREAIHSVFLYHAIKAGMDMGIVNPSTSVLYADIPNPLLKCIENVIFNRIPDATEQLIEAATKYTSSLQNVPSNEISVKRDRQVDWRTEKNLDDRLAYSLLKGIDTYLQVDLEEALHIYPKAVDIIEGPLMRGMNIVGDLFGEGKMFLPQVVKTARTMKKAVSILQPIIESEKKDRISSSGRILLATVKGDVHDIGKNIVSVVLTCNGFDVIDLGTMVPAETIVSKARDYNVDIIGLSGLITPSLDEMVEVAKVLEREHLDIPLMIGGATTSLLHTALKIAPSYHAPVVYVKDASQNPGIAAKLLNPINKKVYVADLMNKYREIQESNKSKKEDFIPLTQAKDNRLNLY